MNILTIGGATQDLCVYYEHQETAYFDTPEGKRRFLLLLEGAKIELESVAYFPGGGANNAAVSYARQGFTTSIVCCIGTDCQGSFVYDNLIRNNVDTRYLIRTSTMATGFSIIITLTTGDRTVLVNRGANLALTYDHLPQEALNNIDQLYITSLTGTTAELLPTLAAQAHQRGIPVAVNPGSSQLRAGAQHLRAALGSIDILILNSYEASLLMSVFAKNYDGHGHRNNVTCGPLLLSAESSLDLQSFCTQVQQHGTKIVVVTNGAEGVYVAKDDCLYFHPSPAVKVVSTLGAGDAFGSGFVGHLAHGGSIEDAIRCGIANSHSVIDSYGAQTGLLSTNAMGEHAGQFDRGLLQKYSL